MFRLKLSQELTLGQKLIAPISLNSRNFSTEKMQALVMELEKHNALLLIADGLQKHNLGSEKKALQLGKLFLEKCSKFLKNTIQINSIERWHKYKNVNTLKIVRWDVWATIKKKELEQASKIIENDIQERTNLFDATIKVADQLVEKSILNIKTKLNDPVEINQTIAQLKTSSIAHQKEELKFLLTFTEFDVHLYPELNASQILAFEKYSNNFKLPLQVSFTLEPNTNILFFPEKKSSSVQNSVSLAGRTLILHFQAYMSSSEVSESEKIILISFLNDQLDKTLIPSSNLINENESEQNVPTRLKFPGRP